MTSPKPTDRSGAPCRHGLDQLYNIFDAGLPFGGYKQLGGTRNGEGCA
jgi:hypothetical protein